VMAAGARALTRDMFDKRFFHGVLGFGGGGGTSVITAAMRELPVGIPKLMVSTMASGDVRPYVDVKDIMMMYSVTDVAGLNPISRTIILNACGAMVGMLEGGRASEARRRKPLIAATMFGVTTPCVAEARNRLEEHGFEVVTFHATGTGGRAMEGLIDDGYFDGVLDVTTTEWCDEVVGGVLSAGPDRHGAAARKGIPQVVSVGAMDMVNFGAMDTVPGKFRERQLYKHNSAVTLMRTTPEECREIGKRMAAQLNKSKAPVVLVLPLKAVSMIDEVGGPFHDAAADAALFESLRVHCGRGVRIREVDANVNDTAFAHALADEMLALVT
ncbi:MAG TPA: Tm-1-like ATP-binding domain-containing protein, partial [Gemmatimonadaceae bacterium]